MCGTAPRNNRARATKHSRKHRPVRRVRSRTQAEAARMTLAVQAHRIVVLVCALALAIAPIANALLVALTLIVGGAFAAYRGAGDLVAIAQDGEVVFRH